MTPKTILTACLTSLQRLCRNGQETRTAADQELLAWGGAQGMAPWQIYEQALAADIWPVSLERNFPTLTTAEQLQLWRSRVLVLGLGGLGGFQASLLARLGVGRLVLADGDTFTLSNLNRQLFASPQTLGQNKAKVAGRQLNLSHPALQVEVIDQFLDRQSLPGVLAQVQVALDALDTLAARRALFTTARTAGVPVVHGAVHGVYGQVATILPQDGEAFPALYGSDPSLSDIVVGIAPTVCLVASLQVQEACRLLLGWPLAYHRRLAHVDGDTGRLEILPLF